VVTMPKQVVDQGGFFILGTEQDHNSLFGGTRVQQAGLTRTLTTVDVTASGDEYPSVKPLRRSYELSGTAYLDGSSLFSLGDTCYATYYSQHTTAGALDQVLFQGWVVVLRVGDSQQQGGYETQEIALRSTGTPAVG